MNGAALLATAFGAFESENTPSRRATPCVKPRWGGRPLLTFGARQRARTAPTLVQARSPRLRRR